MATTIKTIQVVVLTYLLFGVFNLFQHHYFLVPVTYSELFVFVMIASAFVENRKAIDRFHWLLFGYSLFSFIAHPFFWEIFLNTTQQQQLFNTLLFDVVRIIQWLLLSAFFVLLSYDRDKNVLKLEWLVPAAMTLGCLFNPPLWYVALTFIISGLSAVYSIKRRLLVTGYIMPVLIGIGALQLINFFYWI